LCIEQGFSTQDYVEPIASGAMRELSRPLIIVVLVLFVPIVPFLLLGDAFEEQVWNWFNTHVSPRELAAAVVLLLSSDILLPIPSSLVSTMAGARLGILGATAASWLGLTIGSLAGFALARLFGEPLVRMFSKPDDLARLQDVTDRFGPLALAATRPLPILAEATVLLLGATRFPWRQFLPTLLLSNLGIAAAYALLGSFSLEHGQLPLALAGSVILPLIATIVARYLLASPSARITRSN
jgi:uncharacterized membrane protein YdjX (TVP38/TMEM64 family)